MAKVENGALGSYRGKLGPLIFYKIFEKDCVRTKPAHNTNPKSPAQIRQQQKMRLVNDFTIPLKELLGITLAPITAGRSAYHTATSFNLKEAISFNEANEVCFDFSKAVISIGPIHIPDKVEAQRKDRICHITWNNHAGNPTDTALVVAYQAESKKADFWFTGTQRKQQYLSWQPLLLDAPMHVWMVFRSRDEKRYSNTVYLGEL